MAVALVACSTPEPGPEPTPTTASPAASPSPTPTEAPSPDPSPSDDPTDDDPNDRSELLEQPEAMKNVDEEGAVAAAKYFMGLYEYVYLTGDLVAWNEMALPDCQFCQVVSDGVKKVHDAGGYVVSAPPTWTEEPETREVPSREMWLVTLRANVSEALEYNADGDLVATTPGGYTKAELGVLHQGGSWRILGVEATGEK